ncbi:CDP-glucose 4,6-dehydratase [Acetobacterium carbinolicum]|uniref:CDP-glucose 4,6-dehydratase n=1 Tax=Acetobacterium carbinolicum TaxID=52690 RepID=UPI0039BFCC76
MEGFDNVYMGKTVLVTGHTGFKGSWLSIWLNELGANVIGYALDPNTENDNFVLSGVGNKIIDIRGDIRDTDKLKDVFTQYKPEIVFHLAAQPLVRLSYSIPVETYVVNVMGTINVLEAIRTTESVRTGIMITTDKCYENKEQICGYREVDPLGGYDPYSSSKACAELAINSWRSSFFNPNNYNRHKKAIASVRAGNVIGGGDWALDRLVPDCVRAMERKEPIKIRNPEAIRPWQHVLEPLGGYLMLGKKMSEEPASFSEAWNFGPNFESMITVKEIVEIILVTYGGGSVSLYESPDKIHEATILNLDINKAVSKLGWKPEFTIEESIEMTINWYKKYQDDNIYSECTRQINKMMERINR